jgi:methionine aminopeptidase
MVVCNHLRSELRLIAFMHRITNPRPRRSIPISTCNCINRSIGHYLAESVHSGVLQNVLVLLVLPPVPAQVGRAYSA